MKSSKSGNIYLQASFFLFFVLNYTFLTAQYKEKPILAKEAATLAEQYLKININNVSTSIYNTGRADLSSTGDSGFEYPKFSGKTLVYESGLLWGGKVNGQIRSGGSSFNTGLRPGRILTNGQTDNPTSPSVRAFRVRPDYKTGDLSTEAKDENKDHQTIFNQYEKDWNEWPASSGAPFKDVNGNGIYEPSIDIPGVPVADQTIWYIANDLDSVQTKSLYGALPMGIEMQTTVWAYKNVEPLNNMIFKRYLVINKSSTKFEEMYIGIWSDPDLGGDAGDDLIGCDTLLNLGYDYNGDDSDPSYGAYIPSVGFCLLQGPIVQGNANGVAKFKGKTFTGKKNLQMTGFSWLYKYPSPYGDPILGSYNGTIQIYNFLKSNLSDGTPHPNPITGGSTKFPFSGDPITQTGFIAGKTYAGDFSDRKHDRRMMLCSGPFNMEPSDTQEVIFAQIAAGGDQGYSRFASISLLKKSVAAAKELYKVNFIPPATLKQLPSLLASEMDREIILTWGSDVAKINEVEKLQSTIYSFQGYNVYQISKEESTLGEKKLIATFDLKDNRQYYYNEEVEPTMGYISSVSKKFGTDSGIQRFISIKKDYLNDILLNNGSDYDFGVSYFRIAKEADFPFGYVESPISIVTVKPQTPKPGVRYESKFGDLINSVHTAGSSTAEVNALILDPSGLTGNEYEISFNVVNGKTVFNLANITTNKILLTNQVNLSGDNDFLVTEGFILKVKDNLAKPLSEKDVYRFTIPKVVYDEKLAVDDIGKINVFPNPYYGGNRNEFNKYDRHITFTHLPQRAVLRIFNIAGELVRKLEKDSPDQFLRWNMLNENNYQVPSGLYIVHIELPDLGRSKILKLALFTQEYIPDNF